MTSRFAAELLREARALSRLSQTELSRRAAVSQSVISAYESGHREPGLSTLCKLIEATGCRLRVSVEASDAPAGLPDTPRGRRLRQRRTALITAARESGATNVRVFGSVARGDDTDSSDIDMLIDLPPGSGLFTLGALERRFSELLGAEVDLVPADGLKAGLRERILTEAVAL
jgi:uncharacterized protein